MGRRAERKQEIIKNHVGGRLGKQTRRAGACARGLVQVKLAGGVKAAAGTLAPHLHIGDGTTVALLQ